MALFDSLHDTFARIRQWIEEEVNFFRLHLLFFTLTPLVAAGIFYGVNGEFHIRECPSVDGMEYGRIGMDGYLSRSVAAGPNERGSLCLALQCCGPGTRQYSPTTIKAARKPQVIDILHIP